MKYFITGGYGFIGSAVVRRILRHSHHDVTVFDAMTYAAIPEAVEECAKQPKFSFIKGDLRNKAQIEAAIHATQPDIIMHLAAESHVDRSIDGPDDFIDTNIVGTANLLQSARTFYERLTGTARSQFRFQHISTDEVFGSLSLTDAPFTETTRYDPRSPYSASKASSDHLVRAWGETFGLPVVLSNCSNNYGQWQFPEKLIPIMIAKGRDGAPLPVYGTGENVRDWLHVDDHARALVLISEYGKVGHSYNVGGNSERSNLAVVQAICAILDERFPEKAPHADLITYVADRPGHDFRYAIDASYIKQELGWEPEVDFTTGIRQTVNWYLDNETWWRGVLEKTGGAKRLGLKPAQVTEGRS